MPLVGKQSSTSKLSDSCLQEGQFALVNARVLSGSSQCDNHGTDNDIAQEDETSELLLLVRRTGCTFRAQNCLTKMEDLDGIENQAKLGSVPFNRLGATETGNAKVV